MTEINEEPKTPEAIATELGIEVRVNDVGGTRQFENSDLKNYLIGKALDVVNSVTSEITLNENEKLLWQFEIIPPWGNEMREKEEQSQRDRIERGLLYSDLANQAQETYNQNQESGKESNFEEIIEELMRKKAEQLIEEENPDNKGYLYIESRVINERTGETLDRQATNTRIFENSYITKSRGVVSKEEFIQHIIDRLSGKN